MAAAIARAAWTSGCRRSLTLPTTTSTLSSRAACAARESKEWNATFRAKRVDEMSGFTEYEKVQNPPEWRHVEALLYKRLVPKPSPKEVYPSNWTPPKPELQADLPYYVRRSRNHMLPVYLEIKQRGVFRYTTVKNIFGDVVQFERDLKQYLTDRYESKSIVATRRDEINCIVQVKGDYVIGSKQFLLERGF